ncbi:MAG: ribosome small subunit-dependent GTPase A [Oscillospiraceae bacterium]|nr:ribosome small subunit-dependent GTPase A [Oscillospiraceae bacterium]
MEGIITKAVGGLYTVESSTGIYACKARGIFRKQGISPCAGDLVVFEDEVINDILPRKNMLIRPPLANLDQLVFVVSACDPAPNLQLLDRFMAVCEYKKIKPVLVFTKTDLADVTSFAAHYNRSGYAVYFVDYQKQETVQAVYQALEGKVSAFTGNSGVGKSTLLNTIDPRLNLETADISRKLGRGRHTTRTTSLYTLENGGRVADTPGFSTFETEAYASIEADELADCFPEIRDCQKNCRYSDCRHLREPDCTIREAVHEGMISASRYDSYTVMLEEILSRKKYG